MFSLPRYRSSTKAAAPPGRHVLVYDGDCGFCRTSVAVIQRYARTIVELKTFDEVEGTGLLTQLDPEEIAASAHYVRPNGIEFHGGEAMTKALRLVPAGQLFAVLDLWPVSVLREAVYSIVAGNRRFFSRVTMPVSRRLGLSPSSCSSGSSTEGG